MSEVTIIINKESSTTPQGPGTVKCAVLWQDQNIFTEGHSKLHSSGTDKTLLSAFTNAPLFRFNTLSPALYQQELWQPSKWETVASALRKATICGGTIIEGKDGKQGKRVRKKLE